MISGLTKQNIIFLMVFVVILFIDSIFALTAFYRNYKLTTKFTPYTDEYSTTDRLRMRVTDTLYVITCFVCSYFLFFKKGLSSFLVILLWLLVLKSVSHLFLAYYYIINNNKTSTTIQNIAVTDVIFGHILSFILCFYVIFKII
jgi:hypothetical protein